jgi:hypothetical protein
MLHASALSNQHGSKQYKMEFFSFWPGLNEHNVEKYLSKCTSTAKGHLNQQRQNARTTKIKDTQLLDSEKNQDHGIKTQFVYAATIALCTLLQLSKS